MVNKPHRTAGERKDDELLQRKGLKIRRKGVVTNESEGWMNRKRGKEVRRRL